jgi:hypothetical protein
MKISKAFIAIIFTIFYIKVNAQTDSIPGAYPKNSTSFLRQSIVPVSLIGAGLVINYSNGAIGKENIQDGISNAFPDFSTNADNFILFVPALTMYAADLLKIESENDAFTQTKYLFIAGVAANLVTYGLKHITDETRPNGEDKLSFPSGHTANAFVMATVLFHEFKNTKPILAYSGFIFASSTGALRVLNNEHWVSDVLVGAGIGIMVTDLVYRFEPLKNWNPFKNKKVSTIISPSYKENSIGVYANIQF